MVINGKILKIGQTINTFADRVSSYNCGKKKNRAKGTASTTNYFILQSILNINKKVSVYAYFPKKAQIEIFGKIIESSRSPAKLAESEFIKQMELHNNKKPIGNNQK